MKKMFASISGGGSLWIEKKIGGMSSRQRIHTVMPQRRDDRPIIASGAYNLTFFDGDNEYETVDGTISNRHSTSTTASTANGMRRPLSDNHSHHHGEVETYLAAFHRNDYVSNAEFERQFTYERLVELDTELHRHGGLTTSQLQQLFTPQIGVQVLCSICFETSTDDEQVAELPICGHQFHCLCLHRWLFRNRTCPLCRTAYFPWRKKKTKNIGIWRKNFFQKGRLLHPPTVFHCVGLHHHYISPPVPHIDNVTQLFFLWRMSPPPWSAPSSSRCEIKKIFFSIFF